MHYIEVSTYKLILQESQFYILPVSKAVGLIHAKLTFEGATTTVLSVSPCYFYQQTLAESRENSHTASGILKKQNPPVRKIRYQSRPAVYKQLFKNYTNLEAEGSK